MSTYIRSVEVADGYNGKRTLAHLVYDHETCRLLEVFTFGWHDATGNAMTFAAAQAHAATHYRYN